MYINCKTFFSYRYGTYKTDELVNIAKELGVRAMALTNINGTPDAWDFVDFCREAGIKPIMGAEIHQDNVFQYILLAKNDDGLMAINRFISHHKENELPFSERPEVLDNVYVIYALGKYTPDTLQEHELIGVRPAEINKLFAAPVNQYPKKYVIRQPVTFQNKRYYNVHRLLRAVDLNTLLSKLEPKDMAATDETFVAESDLISKFSGYSSIISCTMQVMDDCHIDK
jgi:DNA polymerase III alpha subunit